MIKLNVDILGAKYFQEQLRYQRLIDEGHDIVLPPIRTYGTRSLTTNYWAANYLKAPHFSSLHKNKYKRKILLAVIDTAGKITHPYLKKYCLVGKSFTGEPVDDGNGHGTGSASCYTADGGIGAGPIGWIKVLPLKALRNEGYGSYSSINNAVSYAFEYWKRNYPDHLLVISMSLGGKTASGSYAKLAEQIRAAGGWIAASSGNGGFSPGIDNIAFPANNKDTWAMGSINNKGQRSGFSQGGKDLFLVGPGENVTIAWKNNQLISANGTSFGMPYANASVLHFGALFPQLKTMDQAEQFIVKYAQDLQEKGHDTQTGFGVPILSNYIDKAPENNPNQPPTTTPAPHPPENPSPGARESRSFVFDFEGNYTIKWQQGNNKPETLTVTKIRLGIDSKMLTSPLYDELKAALTWFFTKRGLVLSASEYSKSYIFSDKQQLKPKLVFPLQTDKDFKDALKWTAYFCELLLKKQKNLPIKIVEIEGKNKSKQSTTILK